MLVFSLYDKVACKFISTTLAESEQMFVRTCFASIMMDYALNDVEFYCVGSFDDELGIINPCIPRLCSWDCYKFPETRQSKDKFLDKEKIIEMAKSKKLKFIEQTKNSVKDLENFINQLDDSINKTTDKKRIKELNKLKEQTEIEINRLREIA